MKTIRLGFRKRVPTIAVAALMASMACLGVASQTALAAPKGIFSVYAQCPTSVPGIELCQYVEVTGGEFTIGALQVPIDKTIVFQGGALPAGRLNLYFLLPAVNGESISPTELNIPGGLHSIIDCQDIKHRDFKTSRRGACRGFSHDRGHGDRVTATLEGVASPSNPAILDLVAVLFPKGTGLTFPGRIHLKNPLLGEECYIGSEAHPIQLHLTDGTTSPPPPNHPIAGKLGEQTVQEEEGYETLTFTNSILVDNAFSVPPAEGCGGHQASIIDPLIDETLGLESTAGHNTVTLIGTHRLALAEAVLASEKFPTKEENPPPPPHHHHHWWWSTR
jgi:hypothetical protein